MTHHSRCHRSRAPAGPRRKEEPGPVEKSFRHPNQILLLPPSPDDWLPEGHLARFVSKALDLSAIRAAYTKERGYPPYDPRLMVKLLIHDEHERMLKREKQLEAEIDAILAKAERRRGRALRA